MIKLFSVALLFGVWTQEAFAGKFVFNGEENNDYYVVSHVGILPWGSSKPIYQVKVTTFKDGTMEKTVFSFNVNSYSEASAYANDFVKPNTGVTCVEPTTQEHTKYVVCKELLISLSPD